MNLSIPPPWRKEEWLEDDQTLYDVFESEEFSQYYEEYFRLCAQPERINKYVPVLVGNDHTSESLVERIYELINGNYDPVTKFEMMMALDEFCEDIGASKEVEAALDDMRGEMLLLMIAALNEHYNRETE